MEASSRQLAAESPRRPLRLLLDGRKLRDGGIGVYTENVILGLLSQDGVELSVIVNEALLADPEIVKAEWFDRVTPVVDEARPYSIDESLRLGRRIPWERYDVFHTPHYVLPYGCRIPAVVTVHDLIHVSNPEKFYYPWVAKALIKSAARRAARVVTVSAGSYSAIERLLRRRALTAKLRLVPNALDPYFLKTPLSPDYLQTRFSLKGNYLLAVLSMVKPHKGVVDLLEAFKSIKARGRLNGMGQEKFVGDLKLILVGKGTEALAERGPLLELAGSIKDVYVFGRVSKEELLNLYARALGVVVPSVAEGFCLPVLEAHAQGTAVVARPVPAVQELLTCRDVVARDLSVAALTDALVEFLKRRCLGENGKGWPNLKRFAREDVGRTLLQVYRELWREQEVEVGQ